MRDAFVRALTRVALADPRVCLLTGDLGYKIFDDFAARCPGRFHNVGVAEANMVGVAAGLALAGKRPWVYSIVPFATMRCYEQIRNDLCYQGADVKVVGIGGGLAYGPNGPTHHGLEDLGILRLLPNMTVVAPGDAVEVELAVSALAAHRGPAYLRLGRRGEPVVHRGPFTFALGRGVVVREGEDVTLVSTGGMLRVALDAAEALARGGRTARVVSMPTVEPLDVELLRASAARTRLIATLEEHSIKGGLGGAVAEALSGEARVRRFGTTGYAARCGSQEHLRREYGLAADQVAAELLRELGP